MVSSLSHTAPPMKPLPWPWERWGGGGGAMPYGMQPIGIPEVHHWKTASRNQFSLSLGPDFHLSLRRNLI